MVAAAVLSTVAGLRVGEMAGIKVRGLNGIRGMISLWDEKVKRRAYSRRVGLWASRWVRFLDWWAICKLGCTQHDNISSGPRELERVMAKLLAGSKWQDVAWVAPTLRGNTVLGWNSHARHQVLVQMEIHPNGPWVCGVPGRRDHQTGLRLT